jgi:hypothetical protein
MKTSRMHAALLGSSPVFGAAHKPPAAESSPAPAAPEAAEPAPSGTGSAGELAPEARTPEGAEAGVVGQAPKKGASPRRSPGRAKAASDKDESGDEENLEKMTFYIRTDQPIALQKEKLRRMQKGEKSGMSQLIREALDLAYPPEKE